MYFLYVNCARFYILYNADTKFDRVGGDVFYISAEFKAFLNMKFDFILFHPSELHLARFTVYNYKNIYVLSSPQV